MFAGLTYLLMRIRVLLQLLAIALLTTIAVDLRAQQLVRVETITMPPRNFDLCLGTSIVPEARFHNMSSLPQRLRVQMTIRNEVTGIAVYADTVIVENLPAGEAIDQVFKPFNTNPNILSQLGRFRVSAIVEALDMSGLSLDTMWSQLNGIRRTAQPFNDASNNYSYTTGIGDNLAIPDQHKWISYGASVAEGAENVFDPLSPRWYEEDTIGEGPLMLKAPVIVLDRKNTQGVIYDGNDVGDTLASYPINLKGVTRTTIIVNYHRGERRQYGYLYDRAKLAGPESTILNENGSVARAGDSLLLEIRHPADSACFDPGARWITVAAVDGGKDFGFKRIRVDLSAQDSNKPGYQNYFTQNFQMRLRLKAKSDAEIGKTDDDDDKCYIDNLSVQSPRHPEYGVDWVRAVTPYTKLPITQCVYRVLAKFSKYSAGISYGDMTVEINAPNGITKYYRTLNTEIIRTDTILRLPDWDAYNARFIDGSKYKITAAFQQGADSYEDDNVGQSTFYLATNFDVTEPQEFALDNGTNSFPQITGRASSGVGFENTSGSYAMRFELTKPDTLYGARVYFAMMNSAEDAIRITIHRGTDSTDVPGEPVPGAMLQSLRNGQELDRFASYRFASPVAVEPGTYWLSVSQLSHDNMMLGADISRSGIDMTRNGNAPEYKYIHSDPYGTQYGVNENSGDISRSIAYEIVAGSGNWKPFAAGAGLNLSEGFAYAGSYIPMIRPLVGDGKAASSVPREEASEPLSIYPNPFDASNGDLHITGLTNAVVEITDLLGVHIRTLRGSSEITWDGNEANGVRVPAGVYVVRVQGMAKSGVVVVR